MQTQNVANDGLRAIATEMMRNARLVADDARVEALANDLLAICHEEWRHVTDDNLRVAVKLLTSRIGGLQTLESYIRCII